MCPIRRTGRWAKGVGLRCLVRNDVKSIASSDTGSEGIESLWIELRNRKGKKTLMGVMYRPPSNSQDVGQKINQEIEKAYKKGNITIIMGDFNMQVDWENQVGSGSQEKEFMECLRDVFFEQLVSEPTREQAILDLVMCNEADLIRELKVKEPLGSSDHNIIEFSLQFEREKLESDVTVLQLNKGNYKSSWPELIGKGV